MEIKITKGEWTFSDNLILCNKQIIAYLKRPTIKVEKEARIGEETWGERVKRIGEWKVKCRKEMKANAKLIAASPNLLNACIEALNYHQGAHSEIGHKLKEAIKKATE